jgi:hypothetical protein
MLFLLSVLGGTFNVAAVNAQAPVTNVSGYITANTTWGFASSPYIVVANVTVIRDVLLKIEPGVVVKFNVGTSLVIDGYLTAKGNSTHEIEFTSNSATPAIGDWVTIDMRSHSTANNFDHCRFEYASAAVSIAADCSINASRFEFNNYGILLQGAREVNVNWVQITNNNVSGIAGSGLLKIENSNISMNAEGFHLAGGNIEVRNCVITRNIGCGASSLSGQVNDSIISANGDYGIGAGATLFLANCSVSDNMGAGLLVGESYGFDRKAQAEDCTFVNNTNGLEIIGWHNRESYANATHSTISRNRGSGIRINNQGDAASGGWIMVDRCNITNNVLDGIDGTGGGEATVRNSNISNNRNGIFSCAHAYVNDSIIQDNSNIGVNAGYIELHNSVVKNNSNGVVGGRLIADQYSKIINNTIGMSVFYTESKYITIANNSLVNAEVSHYGLFEYCSVSNSLVGIKLMDGRISNSNIFNNAEYNVVLTGGNDINATYNWWGTTNETLIKKFLYDYNNNYTFGEILYKPYLSAPVSIPTAGQASAPNWMIYWIVLCISATIVIMIIFWKAVKRKTKKQTKEPDLH